MMRVGRVSSSQPALQALAKQALSNGYRALGRYQLTPDALVDAGLMKIVEPNPRAQHPDYQNTPKGSVPRTYRWVGAVDIGSETFQINSAQDFLESPKAQEYAMASYLNELQVQMSTKNLYDFEGLKIRGKEGIITITEAGLVAASHRRGAGTVRQYLSAVIPDRGEAGRKDSTFAYDSNRVYSSLEGNRVAWFEQVETRLREFEKVSFKPKKENGP